MNKYLKIAILLTAMDNMSSVINRASNNAMSNFDRVLKAGKKMSEGLLLISAGKQGFNAMKPMADAFMDIQEAGNNLKTAIMTKGGILDENAYKNIMNTAQKWADVYKAPTVQYLDMIRVFKENRVDVKDVMGGVGEAAAQLSDLFGTVPKEAGLFAARMKNDMGVANQDMGQMMDLLARMKNIGVGTTGEETIHQMTEFFSKVGLGMKALKQTGVEAGREMGILGAIFIKTGLQGDTVGTNIRRMLDGMRDPDRMAKVQAIANQFGKSLSFFNQKGQFIGIRNMVNELGKLQGLSAQNISEILKPFSGKQGLSTDFLEFLSTHGTADYNQLFEQMQNQANLGEKLKVVMSGVRYEQEAYHASLTNLKAAIGQAMMPVLTKLFTGLHHTVIWLRQFVQEHPGITKVALALVAVGSSLLMIAGVLRVIKAIGMFMSILRLGGVLQTVGLGLRIFAERGLLMVARALLPVISATWAWTAALLANPVTWIILAIIALGVAIYAIYKNWDKIIAWMKGFWQKIKDMTTRAFAYLKMVFIKFNPVTLISHGFNNMVAFVSNLGTKFYNAGKNIVMSIGRGIKAAAMVPINAIRGITQRIRNHLPFSPAKEGALRDINRIKLVETIAANIKAGPLLSAIRNVTGRAFGALNEDRRVPVSQAAHGGSIVFSPVFHLHGSATKEEGVRMGDELKDLFRKLMKEYEANRSRTKF